MTHRINSWHRPQPVNAVQTTRNLSNNTTFDIHPKQAELKLIQQLQADFCLPHRPYFMQQVHGNRVIEYQSQPNTDFAVKADACFTRGKNIICAVMTADCLPVLLTDSVGSFVAAVHCGWRSLYGDILTQTLTQVNSNHPILAWLGPCIKQLQYEVDETFVCNYLQQHPSCHTAFSEIIDGKSFACINTLAQLQLMEFGVTEIESSDACTFLDPAYYSWRRNNSIKRMATLTWLR